MSNLKGQSKIRRRARIRAKVSGTAERPRLAVFRSNTSLYLQLIDDQKGATIVSAHSREVKSKKKAEAATELGKLLAEKALKANIKQVIFDRGGNIYTGRVKAVAEGAREGGLEF